MSSGYFGMPPALEQQMQNALGMDITEGISTNWNLLVLFCMIFGLIVIMQSMWSVYKSYRFNNYRDRDGALLKFITGILLVNINWVVMAMIYYV